MDDRKAIMEKARAKRVRRAKVKAVRNKRGNHSGNSLPGFAEKVADIAQEAAAQVGALVKSAAHKVTGTITDEAA
jgi:hypothetical protein